MQRVPSVDGLGVRRGTRAPPRALVFRSSSGRPVPIHPGFGWFFLACQLCFVVGVVDVQGQRVNMPGGVSSPVHPSEHDGFGASVRAALEDLNGRRSDVKTEYTLGRVVSVRKQVVAGMMLYITYEALTPGVARTEVCDAKVWHKLDNTHEVLSNKCAFVVESADDEDRDAAVAEDRLMGGFRTLDHRSSEARSAAVEYARSALGMGGGHHARATHARAHVAEDGPGEERVTLCGALKQIVNGVNYRLTLGVAGRCDITARVYKSFDDVYEVKQDDATWDETA